MTNPSNVDEALATAMETPDSQGESIEDKIRRIVVEELATELENNQLNAIQHYVRQHASTVVSLLMGDDDFLTYLSRNLQGIQIKAINRLLTESNARAPVPVVVRSYVPGALRLMARAVKEEDGTRRVVLDSVETFVKSEAPGEEGTWSVVAVDERQSESLAALLVDSGCELDAYQFLTSDIDLEQHQRSALDLFDQVNGTEGVVDVDTDAREEDTKQGVLEV